MLSHFVGVRGDVQNRLDSLTCTSRFCIEQNYIFAINAYQRKRKTLMDNSLKNKFDGQLTNVATLRASREKGQIYLSPRIKKIFTFILRFEKVSNSYTMGCPAVRGDNPRVLALYNSFMPPSPV